MSPPDNDLATLPPSDVTRRLNSEPDNPDSLNTEAPTEQARILNTETPEDAKSSTAEVTSPTEAPEQARIDLHSEQPPEQADTNEPTSRMIPVEVLTDLPAPSSDTVKETTLGSRILPDATTTKPDENPDVQTGVRMQDEEDSTTLAPDLDPGVRTQSFVEDSSEDKPQKKGNCPDEAKVEKLIYRILQNYFQNNPQGMQLGQGNLEN